MMDNPNALWVGQLLVILIAVSGVVVGLLCTTKACYHSLYLSHCEDTAQSTEVCEPSPLPATARRASVSIALPAAHQPRRASYSCAPRLAPSQVRRASIQPQSLHDTNLTSNGRRLSTWQPYDGNLQLPTLAER